MKRCRSNEKKRRALIAWWAGAALPGAELPARAPIMVQSEPTPTQSVPDLEPPAPARGRKPRPAGGPKTSKDPPKKRGPPRPHRKLPQDVLDGRITKLRNRIERAKGQLEDAQRHIEGYEKESKYRNQDKKDPA